MLDDFLINIICEGANNFLKHILLNKSDERDWHVSSDLLTLAVHLLLGIENWERDLPWNQDLNFEEKASSWSNRSYTSSPSSVIENCLWLIE